MESWREEGTTGYFIFVCTVSQSDDAEREERAARSVGLNECVAGMGVTQEWNDNMFV